MKKIVPLLFALFLVTEVRAGFEFNSYDAPSFVWDPSISDPEYTMTIDFRAFLCDFFFCPGEDYRLAIADEDPGSLSAPFDATNLSEFLTNVSFSQGISENLTPGEWSQSAFATSASSTVTGSLVLTFDSQRLQQLPVGNFNLVFYVVGEDTNSGQRDSMEIIVSIEIPELVKVSGLEDVLLDSADLGSGNNLDWAQSICVFSNTGRVGMDFDSSSNSGNVLKVSKTGTCPTAQTPDCVPYRIRVQTPQERNLTFRYFEHRLNHNRNDWTASDTQSCDTSENMTLTVRFKKNDLDSAQAGVYQDTLTVYVYPK